MPVRILVYGFEVGAKHHHTHDVKSKIRAYLTRIPLGAPSAICRLQHLTKAFNDVNHERLARSQRISRESWSQPSSSNGVYVSICLRKTAVSSCRDVDGLVKFAFLDIGCARSVDRAKRRRRVERESVWRNANDGAWLLLDLFRQDLDRFVPYFSWSLRCQIWRSPLYDCHTNGHPLSL